MGILTSEEQRSPVVQFHAAPRAEGGYEVSVIFAVPPARLPHGRWTVQTLSEVRDLLMSLAWRKP